MKARTKLKLCVLLAAVAAFGSWGVVTALSDPNVIRASATISGPPGSGISGEVVFTQAAADKDAPVPGVWVVANVQGITPGLHGFHIHENGVCDPAGYTTAGGHFDPGPFGNSTPVDANHPYHLGDLPNLVAGEGGVGHLSAETSRITLSQNPGNAMSILDANGSAVIVHQNPDLGLNAVVGASGGPRIACGVIELD
jgi:superoxide dismutase, Cu-Zn family